MSLKQRRVQRIKDAITKKPYVFFFIVIFLAYVALNVWVNQVYVTIPVLGSLVWWFLIPFLLFNFLIVPFLVALTVNLSITKFKELRLVNSVKNNKASSSSAFIGIFTGVFGGACPGCFAGLFPAVLGLFGIAATLNILPLYGLEIQLLSSALLITAIILLTRDTVCKI